MRFKNLFKNKRYIKWPMTQRIHNYFIDHKWEWITGWDLQNNCNVLSYWKPIQNIRKKVWYDKLEMRKVSMKNKDWQYVTVAYYKYDL